MKHVQTATMKILPRNHSFAEKHENIAPRKLPAIRFREAKCLCETQSGVNGIQYRVVPPLDRMTLGSYS